MEAYGWMKGVTWRIQIFEQDKCLIYPGEEKRNTIPNSSKLDHHRLFQDWRNQDEMKEKKKKILRFILKQLIIIIMIIKEQVNSEKKKNWINLLSITESEKESESREQKRKESHLWNLRWDNELK